MKNNYLFLKTFMVMILIGIFTPYTLALSALFTDESEGCCIVHKVDETMFYFMDGETFRSSHVDSKEVAEQIKEVKDDRVLYSNYWIGYGSQERAVAHVPVSFSESDISSLLNDVPIQKEINCHLSDFFIYKNCDKTYQVIFLRKESGEISMEDINFLGAKYELSPYRAGLLGIVALLVVTALILILPYLLKERKRKKSFTTDDDPSGI